MAWWKSGRRSRIVGVGALFALLLVFSIQPALAAPRTAPAGAPKIPQPKFKNEAAADKSAPLRDLAARPLKAAKEPKLPEERGPTMADRGHKRDGALQQASAAAAQIAAPLVSFEGLSNQDNFNVLGGRVNPPDPVGDVGPNHYVEMINLTFAVYDKQGNRLLGPASLGSLWADFPITDCADDAGDPIVLYDQLADRWLLSQFTAIGPKYWNCVAISQTGDPTGAYYRYAFITQDDPELPGGTFFPDYPKYGVWNNMYVLTTRDFGDQTGYGISIYGLERNKMVNGEAKVGVVQYFIDGNDPTLLPLVGDGLLPPDIDGTRRPRDHAPAPIVGTQDDGGGYGGTFDALNIWDFSVKWNATPESSLTLAAQLPTAAFDSIFPCGVTPSTTPNVAPTARDCLPQPGITDGSRFIDILSYRQRPTFRLAYRNFGTYEALVTSQSVEATPGVAGMRWYEIRRANGAYSIHQQGTYAPGDGVHRWMGSIAMDKKGNIGLGYNVVNGTNVFPGIRYTGRLKGDPLGQMTLGEGTIINGSGVQTSVNSRWGDYSSMNVDPVDDCTLWYVNEYYTAAGQATSTAGWQTRIGAFKLPGC